MAGCFIQGKMEKTSGWLWVPSLYMYQGIPYSIVMTTSTLMYTNMGISVASIAFWTSLLYLPWTWKLLWSPIVDSTSTKRRWVVVTQLVVAAVFAIIGMSMHLEMFYPISLALMAIAAFGSASHDIACDGFYMIALNKSDQSFFVGVRTTFYRIAMFAALGLVPQVVNWQLGINGGDNAGAWQWGMTALASTLFILAIYNAYTLPHAEQNHTNPADHTNTTHTPHATPNNHTDTNNTNSTYPNTNNTYPNTNNADPNTNNTPHANLNIPSPYAQPTPKTSAGLSVYRDVLRSFFNKRGVVASLLFMLLYRLGEAQLAKIATPFLVSDRTDGGLGMSMADYGWAYGTAGMVALTIGGLAGGFLASKYGLRRVIWPMVLSMNIPNVVYVLLAHYMPSPSSWTVYAAIIAEQLGYGFGFTAYMLFLLKYVGDSQFKTSEYAIGTTIMALGMMLPGMISGFMKELLGYENFFIYVLICCIPGMVIVKWLDLNDKES